jgi:hypothetical protein
MVKVQELMGAGMNGGTLQQFPINQFAQPEHIESPEHVSIGVYHTSNVLPTFTKRFKKSFCVSSRKTYEKAPTARSIRP